MIDIITAMNHERLFQPWFRGESWNGWRAILKAAYGLPMSSTEVEFFQTVAQRNPPRGRVRELWIAASRRSGKDSIASLIAAHTAAFFEGKDRLRRGERALVLPLACDREQAKIVLGYVKAYFSDIPPLAAMVTRETQTGFELNNNVDVTIATNSYRSVRGRPILCGILDEVAFYADELSANPDVETYNAIKPGMATLLPDAMLVGISSPYRPAGLLFEKYRKHYGVDDDEVLFIKGPTTAFNPTIDKRIIEQAFADDPVAAAAEWNGEFREGVSDYISSTALDRVTPQDYRVPSPDFVARFAPVAATDVAGGSGTDSFATAVAWFNPISDRAELAGVLETPGPFSPEGAIQEHADFLRQYGIQRVVGDKYGSLWPIQRWAAWGIRYEIAHRTRSEIFESFLPILHSERCTLFSHARLRSQFLGLTRRTTRSGKDQIEAPPRLHDDLSQTVASALLLAYERGTRNSPVDPYYANSTRPYVLNPSFANATGLTGRQFDDMARRIAPGGVRYDQ